MVPITIKNIILDLEIKNSFSAKSQFITDESASKIEILTNISKTVSLIDNSTTFIPIHSSGVLTVIFNSDFINMADEIKNKDIIFPENGTIYEFRYFYPTKYFTSNPNPYFTSTTNTLSLGIYSHFLIGLIIYYLTKKLKQ